MMGTSPSPRQLHHPLDRSVTSQERTGNPAPRARGTAPGDRAAHRRARRRLRHQRDLAPIARASFWVLVALIVFGIVLIFVHIPAANLVYSVLGLVIFAGFTMFDFQRLRTNTDVASAAFLAASIFLDILNVFLFFLEIFSQEEG
jgi:hypothetical protein